MSTKPPFNHPKETKEKFVEELVKYFGAEFDYELSHLEAELLVGFLDEKIGKFYYNSGVTDAGKFMREKSEELVFLTEQE